MSDYIGLILSVIALIINITLTIYISKAEKEIDKMIKEYKKDMEEEK